MATSDTPSNNNRTVPAAGPARVTAPAAGLVPGGASPGFTGPSTVGSSIGPVGGTNAAAASPPGESGIARGMTGPAGALKNLSQLGIDEDPDSLGQEGMQSTVKPNTTGGGEPQDRD